MSLKVSIFSHSTVHLILRCYIYVHILDTKKQTSKSLNLFNSLNILHNLNFVYFTFIQKYLFHIFIILLWREISLLSMWRCIRALERNYNIELKVPWEEYGQNALGCKPTNFLLWNLENPIVYCRRNLHISLKKLFFTVTFS